MPAFHAGSKATIRKSFIRQWRRLSPPAPTQARGAAAAQFNLGFIAHHQTYRLAGAVDTRTTKRSLH